MQTNYKLCTMMMDMQGMMLERRNTIFLSYPAVDSM